MASDAQADKIMLVLLLPIGLSNSFHIDRKFSLHKFEAPGGLLCGTEGSRGKISLQRPNRQWE